MSRRIGPQATSRRAGPRAAGRHGSEAASRATSRGAHKTAATALACASLLAAAGCGASSVHDGAGAGATQAARGVRPLPTPQGASAQGSAATGAAGGRARSTGSPAAGAVGPTRSAAAGAVGPTGTQRARRQQGMIDDEVSSSGAKPADPCTLVDRGSAQKIMGTAVRTPVLAPQGPTCIYAARSSRRQVTLAIQGTPPKGRPPQDELTHRMRVKVGGRHAYCGVAGGPTLILPLKGGRFLTVAAPCPIAAAFAGRALAHLHSR